jgi:hypothetical protein
MKGKALRRVLMTKEIHRLAVDIPLILDTTEMISPETAYEMLLKNKNNRPINWQKVEEYAGAMARGEWELHAQGIVLDTDGNVLTGQKRLWAVIYSAQTVAMRVSRGSPKTAARLLDRHTPQTARDLASRETGKKHSPTEASLARAILAIDGTLKPSVDDVARTIEKCSPAFESMLRAIHGTKRTRGVLMILAALVKTNNISPVGLVLQTEALVSRLEAALHPQTSSACWGRGAAFALAMRHAERIASEAGASK